MKNVQSIALLNLARDKTGSDRQTSIAIGESAVILSHIRRDRYAMNDTVAAKIGVFCGIGWERAIALVNEDRARNDEDKSFWKKIAVNSCVVLSLGLVCANDFNSVSYALFLPFAVPNNLYIMRIFKPAF